MKSYLPKFLIIIFILLLSTRVIASANMVVSYPKEILIEKGWMAYSNFLVNNSGDSDIHNLVISIEDPYNWFEFRENRTDIIAVNNATSFIAKIDVPAETLVGSYNFSLKLKSDELNVEKKLSVRVFETRDDILLYQVRNFRNNLNELDKQIKDIGNTKNTTLVKSIASQIGAKLNLAEVQIANKMYSNVTESIREVEKLFIEAKFELASPPKREEIKPFLDIKMTSFEALVFSSIGIVILVSALAYLVRKTKIRNRVRIPNLKLKELVVDNQKIKELEQEIGKIKESQAVIENEFKENMISKDSYDELRIKYQQKLMELESEIKKARGY